MLIKNNNPAKNIKKGEAIGVDDIFSEDDEDELEKELQKELELARAEQQEKERQDEEKREKEKQENLRKKELELAENKEKEETENGFDLEMGMTVLAVGVFFVALTFLFLYLFCWKRYEHAETLTFIKKKYKFNPINPITPDQGVVHNEESTSNKSSLTEKVETYKKQINFDLYFDKNC